MAPVPTTSEKQDALLIASLLHARHKLLTSPFGSITLRFQYARLCKVEVDQSLNADEIALALAA
jgi:hypothetical protein